MATLEINPTAAGDATNLTPSAGANWENVDETSGNEDDDGTYNENGSYDLYNLANHGAESDPISKIEVFCRSRTTGGTPQNHYPKIKIGGTEYNGDNESVSSSYETYSTIWAQNPQSVTAWTWQNIDDLQAGGYVIGAGANDGRLTQVYVIVTHAPAAAGIADKKTFEKGILEGVFEG